MCDLTFISRARDGLILAESWEEIQNNSGFRLFKQQAKQLQQRIGQSPSRCSVVAGDHTFHYIVEDGICFMTVTNAFYTKKLAFVYLEEIHKAFMEMLKVEFGTHAADYRSHIETISKPYHFVKFERTMQMKRQDFRDPRSSKAINKINESLMEVSSIMRKNIEDILTRGENLEDVSRKANSLLDASSKFRRTAKHLSYYAVIQKYLPLLFFLIVFILIILWRFVL